MPVSWKVDPASISKLQRELSEIPRKVILKGGRRGMVLWAEEVKASIRSNLSTAGFDSASIRRSIVHKIVRLKRGKGLWVGVGVAAGKAWGTRNFYIAHLARWYETGWTPYPTGRPTGKTGKNWRKGLRVGSGARIYGTDFIQQSTQPAWQKLPDYIAKAVQAEMNKPEKL